MPNKFDISLLKKMLDKTTDCFILIVYDHVVEKINQTLYLL